MGDIARENLHQPGIVFAYGSLVGIRGNDGAEGLTRITSDGDNHAGRKIRICERRHPRNVGGEGFPIAHFSRGKIPIGGGCDRLRRPVYQLLDRGVLNGMIYTYAVTAFDQGDSLLGIGRLENNIGRGRPTTRVYMANAAPTSGMDRIKVVPNPFMGSSKFNNPNPIETNPWVHRVRFINLPADATISIFTLAGDLVKTIHSGSIVYQSRDVSVTGNFTGVAEWDLTTKNNQETVSGVYVYVVESSAGTHTGKFVIMR